MKTQRSLTAGWLMPAVPASLILMEDTHVEYR
jgi:hypothetical protein